MFCSRSLLVFCIFSAASASSIQTALRNTMSAGVLIAVTVPQHIGWGAALAMAVVAWALGVACALFGSCGACGGIVGKHMPSSCPRPARSVKHRRGARAPEPDPCKPDAQESHGHLQPAVKAAEGRASAAEARLEAAIASEVQETLAKNYALAEVARLESALAQRLKEEVFMTASGECYHSSRSCGHIRGHRGLMSRRPCASCVG